MSDQPMSSTIIKTILGFFFAKAKEANRVRAIKIDDFIERPVEMKI